LSLLHKWLLPCLGTGSCLYAGCWVLVKVIHASKLFFFSHVALLLRAFFRFSSTSSCFSSCFHANSSLQCHMSRGPLPPHSPPSIFLFPRVPHTALFPNPLRIFWCSRDYTPRSLPLLSSFEPSLRPWVPFLFVVSVRTFFRFFP